MLNGGMSVADVCAQFSISKRTLTRWKSRLAVENSLARRPRISPKRAATAEEAERLVEYVREHPFATARQAKTATLFPGSLNTARRRLKENGISSCVPSVKEDLTDNHRRIRLIFSEGWLQNFDPTLLDELLWSDEKVYSSVNDGPLRVWRPHGEQNNPRYVKKKKRSGRVSVHVWGGMFKSGQYVRKRLQGRYDRFAYLDLLQNTMLPFARRVIPEGRFTFQQDNATVHTANVVNDWLTEQGENNFHTLHWPACSPDLSSIENAWGKSTQHMRSTHPEAYNNAEELWNAIQEAWATVVTPDYFA